MFADWGGMWDFDDDDIDRIAEHMGLTPEEVKFDMGFPPMRSPVKPDAYASKKDWENYMASNPQPTPPQPKPVGRKAQMAELAIMPDQKTAWQTVMEGTDDVRCSFREEHAFNIFRALGINPNTPWPPSTDYLNALLEDN